MHKIQDNSLRKSILDTITTIESVVVKIHEVLGEMGSLVKEIDHTTEKLESKLNERVKRKDLRLDTNQNPCTSRNTIVPKSSSKQTTPSPYMDFTYLELLNNCDVCDNELSKFTYNEKYPLWIQYDTWRTGNTTSDVSLVSSGSDGIHTGSESNNNSWRSASHVGEYLQNNANHTVSVNQTANTMTRVDTCCNNNNDLNGKYCGVYEQLMEEQLESEHFSFEGSRSDTDKRNTDFWDYKSVSTLSFSDELIVHYSRNLKSWIPVRIEGETTVHSCTGVS